MQTDAKKEAHRKAEQRNAVLVVAIVVLTIFIFICTFSAIVVIGIRQSKIPQKALLSHPRGKMIVAGSTKQDLEEAIELANKWGVSFLRLDSEDQYDYLNAISGMINEGRLFKFYRETKCEIKASSRGVYKVRITEGFNNDLICWVPKKCVVLLD